MITRFFISALLICVGCCSAYAKSVWCSASTGDDSNPGTKAQPVRTIVRARAMSPDKILLKRGDTFYEQIVSNGIDINAYGAGNPPVICGLKIPASGTFERGRVVDNAWQPSSTGHIWRFNLAASGATSGFVGAASTNNIGAIVNIATGSTNDSRKVLDITKLSEDYDFYQPYRQNDPACFDYLYLYLDTDPNQLPLAFSAGNYGVSAENCSIKNIEVAFWGCNGVQIGSNTSIDHCNVHNIGGSNIPHDATGAPYGNGIECWVTTAGVSNINITNCSISHCFDCGLTVQGSTSAGDLHVENVCVSGNTVSNCCQGWESFLRGISPATRFKNCFVKKNAFVRNGQDSGFRYGDGRFKYCQVLGNSHYPTGLEISNNLMLDGNFRCCSKTSDGLYNSQTFVNNKVYIVRGQFLLSNYNGSADVIRIPIAAHYADQNALQQATEAAIDSYRKLTGDYSTKFIVVDGNNSSRLTDIINTMTLQN